MSLVLSWEFHFCLFSFLSIEVEKLVLRDISLKIQRCHFYLSALYVNFSGLHRKVQLQSMKYLMMRMTKILTLMMMILKVNLTYHPISSSADNSKSIYIPFLKELWIKFIRHYSMETYWEDIFISLVNCRWRGRYAWTLSCWEIWLVHSLFKAAELNGSIINYECSCRKWLLALKIISIVLGVILIY